MFVRSLVVSPRLSLKKFVKSPRSRHVRGSWLEVGLAALVIAGCGGAESSTGTGGSNSGSGGTNGSGGRAQTGGQTGTGGAQTGGQTGTGGSQSGGTTGVDGGAGTGGSGSGGRASSGGSGGGVGSGGSVGSGGAVVGSGGNTGSGGRAGTGGSVGSGGTGTAGQSGNLPGFRVQGRDLYDRCGTKVILRGVNEMIVWSSGKDGNPEYAEIAKTGANVVRIVWHTTDGTPAEMDRAIANAIAQQLIPMVELHDATGDRTKIAATVDHWVRSDVVSVIKKHEQVLLVNIANEAGNGSVTSAQFESDYKTAITRMRNAGYRTPLIIDAPNWGQNIDVLQSAGPALVTHDPDHNIMLSVHMWWEDASGSRVMSEISQSVSANLPLIVGEFAHHAVGNCSATFAYKTLLSVAQTNGIGWLAWSWGSVKNSDCSSSSPFDMTTNGTFATLTGWGLEVAVSDPNSIQKTSVRPASMTTGMCP